MTDNHDIVEKALDDCADVYREGVHSYPGLGLKIEEDAIEHLKCLLRPTFTENLKPKAPAVGRIWDQDKHHVFPAAFYAGVLAAVYAHGATKEPRTVTPPRAQDALEHVVPHCRGPQPSDASAEDHRVRWRYCPPRF